MSKDYILQIGPISTIVTSQHKSLYKSIISYEVNIFNFYLSILPKLIWKNKGKKIYKTSQPRITKQKL